MSLVKKVTLKWLKVSVLRSSPAMRRETVDTSVRWPAAGDDDEGLAARYKK